MGRLANLIRTAGLIRTTGRGRPIRTKFGLIRALFLIRACFFDPDSKLDPGLPFEPDYPFEPGDPDKPSDPDNRANLSNRAAAAVAEPNRTKALNRACTKTYHTIHLQYEISPESQDWACRDGCQDRTNVRIKLVNGTTGRQVVLQR